MKNIPQKIYLQTGHKNPVTDFKMLSLDDVTWSSTRENDTDIEYDLSNHSVLHSIKDSAYTQEQAKRMDKELDIVHECLTELYNVELVEPKIKQCLDRIKDELD